MFWDGAKWTDFDDSGRPPANRRTSRLTKTAVVLLVVGFIEPMVAGFLLIVSGVIGVHREPGFTQAYFVAIMEVASCLFILSFIFALAGYLRTRAYVTPPRVALPVLIITGIFLIPAIAAIIAFPSLVLR